MKKYRMAEISTYLFLTILGILGLVVAGVYHKQLFFNGIPLLIVPIVGILPSVGLWIYWRSKNV